MTLLENERQTLLFRFNIDHVPEEAGLALAADPYTMRDAVNDWKWMVENGRGIARLDEILAGAAGAEPDEVERLRASAQGNKANMMLLKEISTNLARTRATLLLMIGDAAMVNPALLDLQRKTVRVIEKRPTEGVGFAAHLVIDLRPTPRPITYKAVLEMVPSIGRSTVTTYLNWLLRRRFQEAGKTFAEVLPDGSHKNRVWHPKLGASMHLSTKLRDDLRAGQISGVQLICRNPDEMDLEDFTATNKVLRLSTKQLAPHNATAAGRINVINMVKEWGVRHGYDEVLVQIRPDNRAKAFSARVQTNIQDAADAVYSRTYDLVGFEHPLGQCPDAINSEVRAKMIGLLERRELWR